MIVDGHTARTKKVKIGEIANTDRLMIGAYRGAGSGGHFLGSLDEVTIEMADGSRHNPSED